VEFLANYYSEIKIFHIMAMMSWMAVLFYLPRLYVYHVEHMDKKEFVEVVEIQEYKLYYYIGVPALWASIISGLILFYIIDGFSEPWAHAKFTALIALIVYDYSMNYYRKQLLKGKCTKSGKFFRAYNEIPTYLSILIVTFVILKDIPVGFTIFMTALFAFIFYYLMKHAKEPNLDVVKQDR